MTGKHGKTVGACFISGYFLLFFSAGTFGSAGVLTHKENVAKSRWMEETAHIRNCSIGEYEATIRVGGMKLYVLRCDMTYPVGGRLYRNGLHADSTGSLRVRSRIVQWISLHSPESEITVRVNPASPSEYFVQSPLPIHRGDDPDDFIWAAIFFAIAGLSLTAIGRKLVRAGW